MEHTSDSIKTMLYNLENTVNEYIMKITIIENETDYEIIEKTYEEINVLKEKYLAQKKCLRDKIDLSDNPSVIKFKRNNYRIKNIEMYILVDSRQPFVPPSEKLNNEYLDTAVTINDDTTNKLKNALTFVEDSKNVCHAILTDLSHQKEKINNIGKKEDGLHSELQITKRFLVRFAKNIYTNKIIMCFIILLVLGFIFLILIGQKIIRV